MLRAGDALDATVMTAWHTYGDDDRGLAMATVWEKLADVAREAIALEGDNTGREGAGAGARAKVRARYDAAGFLQAPETSSSESGEDDDSDPPSSDSE